MSPTTRSTRGERLDDDALARYHDFEYDYSFDEQRHPSEVTIVSLDPDDDMLTHWLTMDLEHAVPLEEVA